MKTIEDLTPDEKNEIIKDFVSPSEAKLIDMAKYISGQQMLRFDDANMFHDWIKNEAMPSTKQYYADLFLAMMEEKDEFVKEAIRVSNEVWAGVEHLVPKDEE